jgi:hypothetical protein
LALVTVAALAYPFRGGVRIGPDAIEQVLGRFESSELSDLRGRRLYTDDPLASLVLYKACPQQCC